MKLMSPMDSMFLIGESREHPMHVGGLQVFTPPDGAGPEFIPETYEAMLACGDIQPTFRKHPAKTLGGFTNVAWDFDDDIDLEYHVRRSALPTPGRVRELLELTSRLHGTLLDRHRPLWEAHVIESPRRRALRRLHEGPPRVGRRRVRAQADAAVTEYRSRRHRDPGAVGAAAPSPRSVQRRPRARRSQAETVQGIRRRRLVPSTLSSARAALREQQLTLPFRAPRTMLNVPIGGARRCAAQSWSLERIEKVKGAAGATVNDVVLAMCAGALRSYLIDLNALPDTPLIAMVPVNVRTENDADGGGNMRCRPCCATSPPHLDDPAKRLEAIHTSMQENKKVLSQLPRAQAMALGDARWRCWWLGGLPGFRRAAPPPFNIAISNVPGPREPMYWNGARLDGNYPLSIALGRAGAQHHRGKQRRQSGFRTCRMPPQCATPAASARPSGSGAEGPGTSRRCVRVTIILNDVD